MEHGIFGGARLYRDLGDAPQASPAGNMGITADATTGEGTENPLQATHDGEGNMPQGIPTATETTPDAPAIPDALVQAALKAVQERAHRAQSGVLRAMAGLHGVDEAALEAALARAMASQTAQSETSTAEEHDAAGEAMRKRLLLAEAKSVGAELGLLDAQVALALIPPGAVSIAQDGEITGLREALEGLKQEKRYLFASPARGAWAQRVSGGVVALSGVEEAFYRKNPALRK